MSRQFRSDDTSKWLEGFGNGQDGDLNYTGGNFGGVPGHGFATFSGTSGQYTGTFTDAGYFNGSNGGRVGDIVLIHQTRGSNAGNWELNKIIGRSGSTLTLKYPLQNTYTSDSSNKAQIVSSGQFDNVSLSGTTTPYLSWNGNSGGIFFLVVKNTLTINGVVTANNYGFLGGSQVSGADAGGKQGEGISGPRDTVSRYQNGNGGGGGGTGTMLDGGAGGGGGGNASNGQNGGAGQQYPGLGGNSAGNAQLTNMVFGGGGGSGSAGRNGSNIGYAGGRGGGLIFLIASNIVINNKLQANGGNGNNATTNNGGGGGGGAGGSILLKAKTAILNIEALGGIGGTAGSNHGGNRQGGNGSAGRIHLDYKISYSGTTNPAIDVRQDLSIDYPLKGGSFLYNLI